jgi:transcriptional regulator with XRE-family HTH domain
MIRNDAEYREAKVRLADFADQVQKIRTELRSRGLDQSSVDLAANPQESLSEQITWEVQLYEHLRAGELEYIPSFPAEERGKALICLRIVKGWTQRQLAEGLGITEAQVSRDERNEYHGLSLERYARILEAMGFRDEGRFVPNQEARVFEFSRILRTAASFTPPADLSIREAQ